MKKRKVLLRQASKKELTALFKICLNIIKGNIPLISTQFKKLNKYQRIIRTLSDKKVPLRKKKVIVNQKGGAAGAVIRTIASLVLPLLAKLVKR